MSPRAFAVLGVVVLALCGAGLALARSGEQLRDQAPLVDRLEFRLDARELSRPATRADIAALESRIAALEILAARR